MDLLDGRVLCVDARDDLVGSFVGRRSRLWMEVWDCVWRHGLRSFDGRMGRHEFVMSVGSSFALAHAA